VPSDQLERAQNKSQTLTEQWQHFHGNCQTANNFIDAAAANVVTMDAALWPSNWVS